VTTQPNSTQLKDTNMTISHPGPPSKHQLALMIWLAVFPTLTVLNLALGDWLATMPPVVRTFVLATIAVPIVIYGVMPQLHKARVRLLTPPSTS
jgi:antibiotic biosynthesis monooxygenase (ABM) superfamily enzyme